MLFLPDIFARCLFIYVQSSATDVAKRASTPRGSVVSTLLTIIFSDGEFATHRTVVRWRILFLECVNGAAGLGPNTTRVAMRQVEREDGAAIRDGCCWACARSLTHRDQKLSSAPDAFEGRLAWLSLVPLPARPGFCRRSFTAPKVRATNEWFTPEQYITAAREVMGEIDLDPAPHRIEQETVRAASRARLSLTKAPRAAGIWLVGTIGCIERSVGLCAPADIALQAQSICTRPSDLRCCRRAGACCKFVRPLSGALPPLYCYLVLGRTAAAPREATAIPVPEVRFGAALVCRRPGGWLRRLLPS